jgi:cobalt-precorrin-5B (C1)-methyltransferase
MVRTGYTLPVFAVAAAKAALLALTDISPRTVQLDDLKHGEMTIAIAQCAAIDPHTALAITVSDPGDNLDLTAGTPVWAWVCLEQGQGEQLILEAGEGLGRTQEGIPAIYRFARSLAEANLLPLIKHGYTARVRFILPEGRSLAERTSNQAFGILEGLSLLGTSAISQPLSAEEKLEDFRADLQTKAPHNQHLVFYIGANSHQVALNLGFTESQIVQTSNWIGAMLVEAGLLHVKKITLIGYHGKLLKLAGGIFNTSSHLADARIEILTHAAVQSDLPMPLIKQIMRSPTAEAVHKLLLQDGYVLPVFSYLTTQINRRATNYVKKYAEQEIEINTVLCDRASQVIPVSF